MSTEYIHTHDICQMLVKSFQVILSLTLSVFLFFTQTQNSSAFNIKREIHLD